MDKAELKPCPFCGNQPKVIMTGNDYTESRAVTIKCPECRIKRTDAALTKSHEWVKNVAFEHWNQRFKDTTK